MAGHPYSNTDIGSYNLILVLRYVATFPDFGKHSEGGLSIVNTSSQINLGVTVNQNKATLKYGPLNALEVLPIKANKKSAMTR